MGRKSRTSFWRQVSAIAQRQIQLLVADRRYLVFLVLAPVIVGLLPLAVGGHAGFTKPPAGASAPFEPRQIIVLLGFAAILMGMTVSVRDLIGERAIYRHEQAAGLSPSAYLLAKISVFGVVAVIQSALLVLDGHGARDRKARALDCCITQQSHARALRRRGGDGGGGGGSRARDFGAVPQQQSIHRAAGGRVRGTTRVRGQLRLDNGPSGARSHSRIQPGAVGGFRHGVDRGPDESRSGVARIRIG